jgi:hypothetical protein
MRRAPVAASPRRAASARHRAAALLLCLFVSTACSDPVEGTTRDGTPSTAEADGPSFDVREPDETRTHDRTSAPLPGATAAAEQTVSADAGLCDALATYLAFDQDVADRVDTGTVGTDEWPELLRAAAVLLDEVHDELTSSSAAAPRRRAFVAEYAGWHRDTAAVIEAALTAEREPLPQDAALFDERLIESFDARFFELRWWGGRTCGDLPGIRAHVNENGVNVVQLD